LIATQSFTPPAANAVLNGVVQLENKWTVAITILDGKQAHLCSGVLLEPTTVMTAKHCVQDSKGHVFQKIIINAPGSSYKFPLQKSMELRTVTKVIASDLKSLYDVPDQGDVAFLKFDKKFSNFQLPEIATKEQIDSLKPWSPIRGYGYGKTGAKQVHYSNFPRQYELSWGNDDHAFTDNVVLIAGAVGIGCSGDSGGPITAFLSEDKEVLIGVAASLLSQGADGCGSRSFNRLYYENFNLIYPYLDLIK
jgi:V8-like Glu-specific endopeptidase